MGKVTSQTSIYFHYLIQNISRQLRQNNKLLRKVVEENNFQSHKIQTLPFEIRIFVKFNKKNMPFA